MTLNELLQKLERETALLKILAQAAHRADTQKHNVPAADVEAMEKHHQKMLQKTLSAVQSIAEDYYPALQQALKGKGGKS